MESDGPGTWHCSKVLGQQWGQSLSLLRKQIYKEALFWLYLNVVLRITSSLELVFLLKDSKYFTLFSVFGSICTSGHSQRLLSLVK